MKHKHYDMIVAKAANMGLVVFSKTKNSEKWEESSLVAFIVNENFDFFLCLPQHKEACLHWLNGGEVQYSLNGTDWFDKDSFGINKERMDIEYFNSATHSMRIKPRKEKRWIVAGCNSLHTMMYFSSHESASRYNTNGVDTQIIEIEIEVTGKSNG